MITLSMYFQMLKDIDLEKLDSYQDLKKQTEGNTFLLFLGLMGIEIKSTLKDLKWFNADILTEENKELLVPIGEVYLNQDERETRLMNKTILPLIEKTRPWKIPFHIEDIQQALVKTVNTLPTLEIRKRVCIALTESMYEQKIDLNTCRVMAEMWYQQLFVMENPDIKLSVAKELRDEHEINPKIGEEEYPLHEYNILLHDEPLPTQIKYHRWVITQKKILPFTSYMRNNFLNIVAKKHFKNYLADNIAETHAKMNTDFLHHMDLPSDLEVADTLRKWVGIFTKSVILIYYEHYKFDKALGEFVNEKGEKLPQGSNPNSDAFYKYIQVSKEEIREWGNFYRKNSDKGTIDTKRNN